MNKGNVPSWYQVMLCKNRCYFIIPFEEHMISCAASSLFSDILLNSKKLACTVHKPSSSALFLCNYCILQTWVWLPWDMAAPSLCSDPMLQEVLKSWLAVYVAMIFEQSRGLLLVPEVPPLSAWHCNKHKAFPFSGTLTYFPNISWMACNRDLLESPAPLSRWHSQDEDYPHPCTVDTDRPVLSHIHNKNSGKQQAECCPECYDLSLNQLGGIQMQLSML